jgi:LysR family glycine cleavage system transcriptional activator
MASDDLAARRLVRLFAGVTVASSLAYYVVYRPECAALPKLVAFREWLASEAAKIS